MAYYVGDIPTEDLVIEPARNGQPIDLDPFETAAEVVFRDSDGTPIPTSGFTATVDAEIGTVTIEWPDDAVLTDAGLYSLAVTLVTADGHRERLSPLYVAVQDDDGWYTIDDAREDWRDAPAADARLWQLLTLARQQVIAEAPALPEDATVPANCRAGQLMQARNLYNAGLTDPQTGAIGDDDTFQLRVFPVDWMVKQVLRPKRAIPVVG